MQDQNFQNHAKYYGAHHFVFYPIILAGGIFSGMGISKYPEHSREWIAIAILFFLVGWLSFMLRQHYSLGNQDRIIRSEMRLRYFMLTGQSLQPLETQLTFKQLAALRFASDEELQELIQQAIQENLSPVAIKKMIRNWVPDHMRV
ncbi:DUF6526 family protein [Flavihumibacter profundi]|uniref:DUF6526 family protein n=1 Tax=Flavihumibacter profundi TaxID=2716883 RepID=UPI001CC6BF35|nr:DUF6526 family protein [Flavihumibacter profundi]MBZ5857654.1 DUF6526 family protein [Flavihumibacter profundi]